VTVTFLGLVRDQMGAPRLEVSVPKGSAMEQLLQALAPVVEDKLGDWAWDRKGRCFTSRVTVARVSPVADKGDPLMEGEEVIVFPPMAGG